MDWNKLFEMPQLAIILGCGLGCLIPIIAVIAKSWSDAQKVRYENHLKQKMIERGFSVDEIEQLLSVEGPDPRTLRG